MTNDQDRLLLYGESGYGKSALIANYFEKFKKSSDSFVIEHYIGGAGELSNDLHQMLRRIMLEIKEEFNLSDEVPSEPQKIMDEFALWLHRVKRPTIIVFDGYNQIEDEMKEKLFYYIPDKLESVKLIISSIKDNYPIDNKYKIEPLTKEEQEKLVVDYLKEYGKEGIALKIQNQITKHPQTDNTLFLRTLLNEIRLLGNFDKVEKDIANYLQAKDVVELFIKIFDRLESDYRENLAKEVLSLLYVSRDGLSEDNLMEIINQNSTKKLTRLEFSPLFLAVEEHLIDRGGLYGFFHGFILEAVEKRYLSSDELVNVERRKIADYFEDYKERKIDKIDNQRIRELLFQLVNINSYNKLVKELSDDDLAYHLYNTFQEDLYIYWAKINKIDVYSIEDIYYNLIHNIEKRPKHLSWIIALLGNSKKQDILLNMLLRTEKYFRKLNQMDYILPHIKPLVILLYRNELDILTPDEIIKPSFFEKHISIQLLKEQEVFFRKTKNHNGLAENINTQIQCYIWGKQYLLALELIKKLEDISKNNNLDKYLMLAYANKGYIQDLLFNEVESLSSYNTAIIVAKKINDYMNMADILENRSSVYASLNRPFESLIDCFHLVEIRRKFGMQLNLSNSLSKLIQTLHYLGSNKMVLKIFDELERNCSTKQEYKILKSLNNYKVNAKKGRYAMDNYKSPNIIFSERNGEQSIIKILNIIAENQIFLPADIVIDDISYEVLGFILHKLMLPEKYQKELTDITKEEYYKKLQKSHILVKALGNALFLNKKFLSIILKKNKVKNTFQDIGSILIWEIFPSKDFTKKEVTELMAPYLRVSLILMKT